MILSTRETVCSIPLPRGDVTDVSKIKSSRGWKRESPVIDRKITFAIGIEGGITFSPREISAKLRMVEDRLRPIARVYRFLDFVLDLDKRIDVNNVSAHKFFS